MAESLFVKYEKELKDFQEWICLQPQLSRKIDKLLLLRFLKVCEFDLKKAQELLLLNLEIRHNNPNLFENRDVSTHAFQQAFSTYQLFPMPINTSDNNKISISRLLDTNPDNYVFLDAVRADIAMLDARLVTLDSNELIEGEIAVIDMKGFGWRHFMKCVANLSIMKKHMNYMQEAAPIKLVQNHFINCPSAMEKFIAMITPFLKKETLDSIKFHTSVETLIDYIPKHLLPNEYGGTAGKCDDFHKDWLKVIESKRDYILTDDNWKLDYIEEDY